MRAVLLIVLLSCGSRDTRGHYIEQAMLSDGPRDHRRVGPIAVAGDKFVLSIGHHYTPVGCVTERMRQTDIWIELPARPTTETRVDLAKARVLFQYGGQVISFASESCKGELVVVPSGDELDAQIDITCDKPRIGEGERSFAGDVTLMRHRL